MSLVNGWIVPNGEERFDELHGRRASVEHYFANPHRMLIVGLADPREAEEPLFLLCTGVTRLETAPSWSIDDLHCSNVDSNTIAVADKKGGFHVTCHALRLFSLDEFKSSLGNEQHLVNPSANSLHTILQGSVEAF